MKYIKTLLIALLLLPNVSFAAYDIGWSATSTTQGWIWPNLINGVVQKVAAFNFISSYFTATSSTATSTFAGAVGVATSTPYEKFEVAGNVIVSPGSVVPIYIGQNKTSPTYNLVSFNGGQTDTTFQGFGGGGSLNFFMQSLGDLIFRTGGANARMTILSTGNVGVGTTTPYTNLSVEGTSGITVKYTGINTPGFFYTTSGGSVGISSNVSPSNVVQDSSKSQWSAVMSQVSDSFAVYRSPAGATWTPVANMYIANTGNVGFGTTSPYAKVSVVGEVVGANFTATTTASSTLPNLVTTNLRVTGKLYDSSNSAGTSGYVLQTNGTGAQWVATSTLGLGGSGGGSVTSVDGSGGTTGLSLTGGPITSSGTLTLGGILNIANGGTGTSTAPTYGKLLVGNALGTYDLLATSSLGISGGSVSGGTAGMLASWTSSSALTATGTPTAASYVATSSTATSTFAGGLTVGGFTGIGTTTPLNKLQISANSTGTYPSDYGVGQLAITGATDARKRVGMLLDSTNNWFSVQAGQYGVTTYPIKLNPQGGKVGINDGSTVAPTYRLTGGSPSSALNTFLSAAPSAFVNSTSDNGTTFAGEYTGASGAGSGSFITLQSNDGAALSSGDRFAGFNFGGYNGSASLNSGAVTAWASEDWTASSMPTEIRFENAASGATSRTTNGIIKSTGRWGLGTTTPATKLHVSSGASATTTISIGELGLSSSKACINMNQVNGSAGSIYIAGGVLIVENNYCR